MIFIRNHAVDTRLEKAEKREQNFGAGMVSLTKGSTIGQCVIVQEKTGGNVKSYEDVDGIMLVSSQNEKNAKEIENPRERVQKI